MTACGWGRLAARRSDDRSAERSFPVGVPFRRLGREGSRSPSAPTRAAKNGRRASARGWRRRGVGAAQVPAGAGQMARVLRADPPQERVERAVVPLHPPPAAGGFLDFAGGRRPKTRPFYEGERAGSTAAARNLGSKLREWVKDTGVLENDLTAPFHGWLHRFRAFGRDWGIDEAKLSARGQSSWTRRRRQSTTARRHRRLGPGTRGPNVVPGHKRLPLCSISGAKSLTWLERVKGIEPSYSAWKAAALPLSYTRIAFFISDLRPLARAVRVFFRVSFRKRQSVARTKRDNRNLRARVQGRRSSKRPGIVSAISPRSDQNRMRMPAVGAHSVRLRQPLARPPLTSETITLA